MVDLATFMKQLSYEMEADPSTLESGGGGGVYKLPLEENLVITISKTEEGVTLFSEIADCPKGNREEFLSEMLLGNLFGQGTSHAILGLSQTGQKMTLSRHIQQVSYTEFMEIVEDFINIVDFWREEAFNHQ